MTTKTKIIIGSIAAVTALLGAIFWNRKNKNLATKNGFPFSINPNILFFNKSNNTDVTTMPKYKIFRYTTKNKITEYAVVQIENNYKTSAIYDNNGKFISLNTLLDEGEINIPPIV